LTTSKPYLNKEIYNQFLSDMRLGNIFSNMKDEVFGTIYDMLSFNYTDSYSEIFTKNNRLFYIGLFLILVCIILAFKLKFLSFGFG
jgi:hypothetical protein